VSTRDHETKSNKILFLIFLIGILTVVYSTGLYKELSLENIQDNLDLIRRFYYESPVLMVSYFFTVYVLITTLSIPGAIVLTLLSGAIFGVLPGTLLVSLASCLGATLAFLMSRYLFRESMTMKFNYRFQKMNRAFTEKGNFYLFTLRLIPVSPFVVVNILMGLTTIRLRTYIWITFLGMIPGTLVYVYAGRRMAEIESPADILTWPVILLLTLMSFLPYIIKKISRSRIWHEVHG
jgi:uncharacterized membrane protein YdjX (TVP38/TMEM64 family)